MTTENIAIPDSFSAPGGCPPKKKIHTCADNSHKENTTN